jgi:hypothetical protein
MIAEIFNYLSQTLDFATLRAYIGTTMIGTYLGQR